MKMTLDDYKKKYGEESGTKRYNGMIQTLTKRQEKYKTQPFKRLTKEWFIWRYPEDGEDRWQSHVNKSKHTLENFISRYGEIEGQQKYKETISKKNTVKRTKELLGDDAEPIIAERYRKSLATRTDTLSKLSSDEKTAFFKNRAMAASQTKKQRYGGKSKLECFCDKYGDDGPKKYGEYLQTIFKGIGHSKAATNIIEEVIYNNSWLLSFTLYYRSNIDRNMKEWFIADKDGICFYDLAVMESKTILEYDGAIWHPTEDQANTLNYELMAMTGLTFREAYDRDKAKIAKAISNGFDVFVVRSDLTKEQTEIVINQFIKRTKEKCNIQP